MQKFAQMYGRYLSDRDFLLSVALSLGLLVLGAVSTFYAGLYASERASNAVTDIILSNIPVLDVEGLFVYGTFTIGIFVVALGLARPQWIPFIASSLGLFYCIRAVFVSLTHLAPFPSHITLDIGYIIGTFIGGDDLFFSGHTGAPFLLALVFWNRIWLRYIFLAWSVFFATIVLLGHLHYSIDVLAAYFITYTIFHIAELFFRKYRTIFHKGIQT